MFFCVFLMFKSLPMFIHWTSANKGDGGEKIGNEGYGAK